MATDYGALSRVMEGRMRFSGLPKGRTETGQVVEVGVSLFGRLPEQPYRMEVLECDEDAMVLRPPSVGRGSSGGITRFGSHRCPAGARGSLTGSRSRRE
ncbi:hypothetical protein [Pseudoroseicyclus tamaricis]|uniref:Uncharacterized protein n=1 Tax=Pseudoroseicyclus tamaricis TaxID=2705421 RepID=A0A6B2JUS2_9RHOB|nr:hypothetical protein [Pseudoroseicyclus tamaricis]NDV02078.1 hypothetical protein [Pseudoroseicyclus tamaricis]